MKAFEFDEAAWTEEIGGVFTDLKLKIKPYFEADRRRKQYSKMDMKMVGRTLQEVTLKGNDIMEFDTWLELIVDWDNFVSAKDSKPIPCTPENVKKYLGPLLEEETGQIVENGKDRVFSLSGFISEFSGKHENFEKN